VYGCGGRGGGRCQPLLAPHHYRPLPLPLPAPPRLVKGLDMPAKSAAVAAVDAPPAPLAAPPEATPTLGEDGRGEPPTPPPPPPPPLTLELPPALLPAAAAMAASAPPPRPPPPAGVPVVGVGAPPLLAAGVPLGAGEGEEEEEEGPGAPAPLPLLSVTVPATTARGLPTVLTPVDTGRPLSMGLEKPPPSPAQHIHGGQGTQAITLAQQTQRAVLHPPKHANQHFTRQT
jgi:hypothetical protein